MARRMRKRVEYRFGKSDPHNASFERFIMSEQAMKPTMQVGHAMKREMERNSPRSGDGRGKPYADSFVLRAKPEGIVAGKYQNRRVAITIGNTARHAPGIEYGVRKPPKGPPRPGRRVMLRAGTKFGDSSLIVGGPR